MSICLSFSCVHFTNVCDNDPIHSTSLGRFVPVVCGICRGLPSVTLSSIPANGGPSVHLRLTQPSVVSIIQTYRPWTPRRTFGRIVNKKIWCESEAYQNLGKRFDWSLAIKRHIVRTAPIVETIWLVNGFKRHIVMALSTLACHTYCDTGHPFLRSSPRTRDSHTCFRAMSLTI